ncbi:MAG: transposase, partial [Betaproteobacteria bacterium]|nr:transposase [Betaproteobacteria bacterium]
MVPDLSVHIVQRGHDRSDCFFEDSDYRAYLGYLGEFASRFACSIHAYCLMTNHVHLLVTPRKADSCALLMKNVAQHHVQRINSRRDRTGTLWEGRFYSCPVPSERYLLTCYRYIELNPQRAAMVRHPSEYAWSSYNQNAGGDPRGVLSPHSVYLALAEDPHRRGAAYRVLCDEPVDMDTLDRIRSATRGGYAVGSARRQRGRPRQGVMR